MKDTIISLIKIVGFLSTTYLVVFCCLLITLLLKVISGTATQSGTGEFLQFAFSNYWILIVSIFFSFIFLQYNIIHAKNEKKRKEKKFKGSLIGKPY